MTSYTPLDPMVVSTAFGSATAGDLHYAMQLPFLFLLVMITFALVTDFMEIGFDHLILVEDCRYKGKYLTTKEEFDKARQAILDHAIRSILLTLYIFSMVLLMLSLNQDLATIDLRTMLKH